MQTIPESLVAMKKLSGAVRTLQRGVRRYLLFQKSMVRVESVHSIFGEEGESDLILIDKNDMENGSGNKIDYEIDQMCLSTDNLLKSGVDTGTDNTGSETINVDIGVENPTEPNTDEDTLVKELALDVLFLISVSSSVFGSVELSEIGRASCRERV